MGEAVYREYRSAAGNPDSVGCTWEQWAAVDCALLVVPDGCVDLIWLGERDLVIAGPDTRPHDVRVPAGRWTSGVRLRPGAAGLFFGRPASELRDRQADAEEVFGGAAHHLIDRLAAAGLRRRRVLLLDVAAARAPRRDRLVAAAAALLADGRGRVGDVARDLGVSERQLHRRTVEAVGYGPKMLGRVARLRRFARPSAAPLAERALAAGYASQAHLNDDVRRLTGRTPVRFLEDPTLRAV